ncbi:MAG: hypothetical protein HKN47_29705 [Pirellulaceae bacterium]|nr:hypothetical protein [Pirellulaceae bacterium]
MNMLTRSERLALLLNLLGDEATEIARTGMQGGAREELEAAIRDFETYPPSQEEIDLVLDDFESYFKLALSAVDQPEHAGPDENLPASVPGPKLLQIAEEQFDVEVEPTKKFAPPELTGNTILDLNRVHPYQVARALKDESPAVITLVVRKLANEHAAKTIEYLPAAVRPVVFLQMAQPSAVKPMIEERVLQQTLQMALQVEERQSEVDSAEMMANLMRSLPQAVRAPMLEELARTDKEAADAVKQQLYQFQDLERLEPRDLQKLLAQCPSDVLGLALQNANAELLTQVLSNMSKRAKESLQEEMEYMTNAKEEEIERGRADVVKLLLPLIESGEISL